MLQSYIFLLSWVKQYTKFLLDKKLNLATLQHLVTCGVISKGVSEKISKSALCYQQLQLAYERNGEDEIQALFGEKLNGSVRIKKSKKLYPLLLSTSKVNESNIRILNMRVF